MSTVPEFAFDRAAADRGDLFPASIADDDWVAYHGTSSLFEDCIEREGISPASSAASDELVAAVVSVYREMEWCGEHGGGYRVLQAYTPFASERGHPVWLAESSCRAMLYATSDFAGGEIVRGVRHAIGDLQEYLVNPAMRTRHEEQLQYLDVTARSTYLPWLSARVEKIIPHVSRLPPHSNVGGLVYAVKFEEADLSRLDWNHGQGLMCKGTITPDRLVGKVRIPSGEEAVCGTDRRRNQRLVDPSGMWFLLNIIAEVRDQIRENPSAILRQ